MTFDSHGLWGCNVQKSLIVRTLSSLQISTCHIGRECVLQPRDLAGVAKLMAIYDSLTSNSTAPFPPVSVMQAGPGAKYKSQDDACHIYNQEMLCSEEPICQHTSERSDTLRPPHLLMFSL